ncbi:MAG TPA: ABC transporter substrate-binding protein [Trebonia sp.]|nr:ABC transporter substrate-binding protein [Trebonia sp.]
MRRALILPACATGVLIASAMVSGCSSSASSPAATDSPSASTAATTTITIGLPNSSPSFANSDVAVAQAEGFFKQEGLVVNVDDLSSGVPVVQGVVGGSLDIGASSIEPVVNAAAAGAPIQIIGSYADKLTVQLVTGKDITSAAGLRGKRLGIQAVGAFREVMTRMVLENAGLTPGDVTYVPGSSSAYISELLAGEIQSGVLQEEQTLKALGKDSSLHVLVNFAQEFPDYFYGTYVVSKSWLASNEVTAGKFLAAITLAHRFMYSNEAATVAIVAKNTGYKAATIKKAYQALLTQERAFPVNSGLSVTRIADTIATMQRYKTLTGTAPAASSLVNTTIIDGVLTRLGTLGKPLDD